MRTLALASGKGGSGKTTLAIHLAEGLRRQGRKVLLVDLDPTGHATAWLLGLAGVDGKGAADALREDRIEEEHLRPVEGREGLHVLPATMALHTAGKWIAGEPRPDEILRGLLREVGERWDYALLDCPPDLGSLTLNALCAADGVVAPVLPGVLALGGLRALEGTVAKLERRGGEGQVARILGYVLFAADPRENLTGEARELLKREAPTRLFKAEVRVSTAAKVLPLRRETAWDEGADPRGAEDYPAVLRETLSRLDAGGARLRKVRA
jgi:chromosome partitioning protein